MESIKEIVRAVNAAFRDNNMDHFLNYCTDNIVWEMVGEYTCTGKDEIRSFMKNMGSDCGPTLTEELIIVGEDSAAGTGTMEMSNADGTVFKGAFCDTYQFTGGKISAMKSYIVDLSKK